MVLETRRSTRLRSTQLQPSQPSSPQPSQPSSPQPSTPLPSKPKEKVNQTRSDVTGLPSRLPSASTRIHSSTCTPVDQNTSIATGQGSSGPQKRRLSKRTFFGDRRGSAGRPNKSPRNSDPGPDDDVSPDIIQPSVPRTQLVETTPHEVNVLKEKNCKLEETLTRTRDTLLATIDNQNRRIQELEKLLAQHQTQIRSLQEPQRECSCTNKNSERRKEGKIDLLDVKYQPVARKVMKSLRDEANDIVREVVAVDSGIIRDWTGKIEVLGHDSDEDGPPIIDLGDERAVPKCPMTLALCGSVYTLPSKMSSILEDIVKSEVEEVSGEAFNDEERKTCVSTIVRHKPIVTWFSRVLSETASLKKLNLKCKYFELLGYRHINRAAKEKNESAQSQQERLHEQKHAKENIFKLDRNGIPIFSRWRLLSDEEIRWAEVENDNAGLPLNDKLFKNDAAKQAFLRFLDAEHEDGCSDSSILMLARADAWITVCLEMLEENETRGGKRNNRFRSLFKRYIPLAMEAILLACRNEVLKNYAMEARLSMGRGRSRSSFGNDQRRATIVFRMPSSGLLYLAVRSGYFANDISTVLGNVKDCYIGRASPSSKSFHEILASDSDHHELSDAEDTEKTYSEHIDQDNE